MVENDPTSPDESNADKPILLEDVIIALQKTFSRVNSLTQVNRLKDEVVDKNFPTARLGQNVQFETMLRVSPFDRDHLKVEAHGAIELRLKGDIDIDVVYQTTESNNQPESQTKTPAK